MDRINVLLQKNRLLYYPAGTHLQGVLFEKNLRHRNPETVLYPFQTYPECVLILLGLYSRDL